MTEVLIKTIEKNVYDMVQHLHEDDIWADAYKEAKKQINALSIEQKKALEKYYRFDDIYHSIADYCLVTKRDDRWNIDDEADARYHFIKEN